MPANTPNFIRWGVSTLERVLIKFVDCVIIVDKARVSQLGGLNLQCVEVIMNCVEDVSVGRSEAPEKSKDFTIFYGGMMSKTRGLNQLAEAVDGMLGVEVIIAGRGEDEEELVELFQSKPNMTYIGHLSLEKAIDYTSNSDVIFGFYYPNKLFEAMMCGTPIIVNQETSMAEIVRRERCGVIVPYNDTQALRQTILELKSHPELCTELGSNGRQAYEREFNWQEMERRLINIYSRYD